MMVARVTDHHGILHRTAGGPGTICWRNGAPLGCTPLDVPGPTARGDEPDPPHEKRCPVCYPEEQG